MKKDIEIIRRFLLFFMVALLISGLTAIPIDAELSLLLRWVPEGSSLNIWLYKVLIAYRNTDEQYPFLLYGYDWLAFAHVVLAILFIGPYRDPVTNIWVVEFGMIACALIPPVALIAGSLRNIPIGWQVIDSLFGVIGAIPLWICHRKIRNLRTKKSFTPKNQYHALESKTV